MDHTLRVPLLVTARIVRTLIRGVRLCRAASMLNTLPPPPSAFISLLPSSRPVPLSLGVRVYEQHGVSSVAEG